MYGINDQLIVCMLVVLIMFKNRIDKYLAKLVTHKNKNKNFIDPKQKYQVSCFKNK